MALIQYTELRNYLLANLGLSYHDKQENELHNKIKSAAKEFNFDNTENFITWLINQTLTPEQTKKLATFLTIGETYFFREKKALDFLEFKYLPDLIYKRRGNNQNLKIWSAGCSSGEEPYSVAIMLKRIIPDIKNWNITILATDINATFLKKAKEGVYSKWSFRGIPESFKTSYFKETENNKYQIKPEIKKMVDFSYLNLATPPYHASEGKTGMFDVILCRNVLIYFSHEGIKTVTTNFHDCLHQGGVLLLSPVETSNLISEKFNRLSFNGITIYENNPGAASKQMRNFIKHPTNISNNRISKTITTPKPKIKIATIAKPREKPLPKIVVKTNKNKKVNEASDYQKTLNLFKAGHYNEVEKRVNDAIKNGSQDKKSHLILLARIKANQGLLAESEKFCIEAIELDKINTEAHYLLATVYNEQGKVKEALNSINSTLFLDPDFALGHFLLGNISKNGGENSDSKKHFNNALKSLSKLKHDDIIAESDGLTAGRLSEIIRRVEGRGRGRG